MERPHEEGSLTSTFFSSLHMGPQTWSLTDQQRSRSGFERELVAWGILGIKLVDRV